MESQIPAIGCSLVNPRIYVQRSWSIYGKADRSLSDVLLAFSSKLPPLPIARPELLF